MNVLFHNFPGRVDMDRYQAAPQQGQQGEDGDWMADLDADVGWDDSEGGTEGGGDGDGEADGPTEACSRAVDD